MRSSYCNWGTGPLIVIFNDASFWEFRDFTHVYQVTHKNEFQLFLENVWSNNDAPLSPQHIHISSYIKCYSFTALMVDSIMTNPNELAKYNFKIKTIKIAITS